jgi:hypothetical protein
VPLFDMGSPFSGKRDTCKAAIYTVIPQSGLDLDAIDTKKENVHSLDCGLIGFNTLQTYRRSLIFRRIISAARLHGES